MKTVFMLTALLMFSGFALAENMENRGQVITEGKELKKEVGNKICPIEGAKIGSMGEGAKVEYEGRIYNLSSTDCIKAFNEDPEKFHKIADKEVGLVEENETKIPENLKNHIDQGDHSKDGHKDDHQDKGQIKAYKE